MRGALQVAYLAVGIGVGLLIAAGVIFLTGNSRAGWTLLIGSLLALLIALIYVIIALVIIKRNNRGE